MRYPDELIDRVRDANDIVDVISACVPLKKRGANFVGLCPFHAEKTGSFNVSPTRQIFKCFGCGKGGNVFNFVMEYENLTFPDTSPNSTMNRATQAKSSRRSTESWRGVRG